MNYDSGYQVFYEYDSEGRLIHEKSSSMIFPDNTPNMMQMVIKKYIKKNPLAQNIGKNMTQKEIKFMKRIPMAKNFGANINMTQKEI